MNAFPPTPFPRKGVTLAHCVRRVVAAPPWGGPAEAL